MTFIQSIANIFILLYSVTLMAVIIGFLTLISCNSGNMCGVFLGLFSFPLFLLSSLAFLIHVTAYVNLLKGKSLFLYILSFSSVILFGLGTNGEFLAGVIMFFYSLAYISASLWFVTLQNKKLEENATPAEIEQDSINMKEQENCVIEVDEKLNP